MNKQSSIKNRLVIFFQGLGAALAFVLSMIVANLLGPLSPENMATQASAKGFLPAPQAILFNATTNALILVWVARRSSFKGLALVVQLFVLSFGAQVVMTQIETAYFISAFPLLNNNFQVYILLFRGLITSLLFSLLVTWMVGGFSKKPRPQTAFITTSDIAVRHGSWLPVVYIALYLLFGYFVAWRVQQIRLFYGGPAELNGPFQQWGLTLMAKPEFPAFQYFRGVLWMLCLVPVFMASPASASNWSSSRRWRSHCCRPPGWPLPTRLCLQASVWLISGKFPSPPGFSGRCAPGSCRRG